MKKILKLHTGKSALKGLRYHMCWSKFCYHTYIACELSQPSYIFALSVIAASLNIGSTHAYLLSSLASFAIKALVLIIEQP